MNFANLGIFDFFFLSMIAMTGFVGILLLIVKFFADISEENKKARPFGIKYNGRKGPMAVRNR